MEDQEFHEELNTLEEATTGSSHLFKNAQDAVDHYRRCATCHGFLHFSYFTDFAKNITQETARCPECNHVAHRVSHKLQ